MADRHAIHINQVHAGCEIGPHAPFHEVHDDLAGGRRLDVPFSDRRAGVHDDHRQARPGQFEDLLLGQILGPLVIARHLGERHRRLLRPRPPIGRQSDRADRAGVDDPLGAELTGGLQQDTGPGDVHLVED